MALLRTLPTSALAFEVVREAVTHTTNVDFDNGAVQLFNRMQRPIYRFDLNMEPLTRYDVQELSAFHAFHQGGKSFLFSGGKYGNVEHFHLFAEGNGTQAQFFLPNRYVGVGSLSIQSRNQATLATSSWLTTAYSLSSPVGGIVTFNSAPSSGHDMEAKYGCQYRCVFEPDGIKVSEFTYNVYKAVQLKLKEVLIYS
jgi:hypothetical protein